jgi:hypothetical protein
VSQVACVLCGAEVHAWCTRDGVCEACIHPRLRAFEQTALRREARERRWRDRAERSRWWAIGVGGIGIWILIAVGGFALAAHACEDASSPARHGGLL